MRIAVIADIHANLYALTALIEDIDTWKPDRVVVLGDVVNRGPRPRECLDIIMERAETCDWLLVRGNHEDYVIDQAARRAARTPAEIDVHRATIWTLNQLDCDVSALEAMPDFQSFPDPMGNTSYFTHASMRGNRDGIYPETDDRTLRKQIGDSPALFCVGHTHRPLIRVLDGSLVVNVGSAGLPFDGDRRPSYGRLTWTDGAWQAEIARFDYDFDAARRDFFSSGYVRDGGPLVRLVLVELDQACSMLYYWAVRYQKPALEGKITMAASVEATLEEMAR